MNRSNIHLFVIVFFLISCNGKKISNSNAKHLNDKTLFTLLSSEETGIDFNNALVEDVTDESFLPETKYQIGFTLIKATWSLKILQKVPE